MRKNVKQINVDSRSYMFIVLSESFVRNLQAERDITVLPLSYGVEKKKYDPNCTIVVVFN